MILPSLTFAASATAIIAARGVPVFVDCDELGLIDPKAVELAITDK